LGLGGRKKHMHTTGNPILQAQTSMEGEQQHPRRQLHLRRSPTEPQTATQAKDLRSEGRRQHHARAIAARVSSRNPARADGSASRPEASASCPRGHQPGSWPREPDSGASPASGRPGQAPANEASFFEPTPPLSTLTPLPSAPAHRRAAEGFLD
jgi:hypothetical protein